MKKAVALLAVLVVLCGVLMPTSARAGGWHGHHGHGCCWGWGWFWPGALLAGLVGTVAVAATAPFAYAAPPPPAVYQAPPTYVQPAPAYAMRATYTAPPPAYAAPPVQREVSYPHGKYVLYGDGITQAWQWVWVPAPTPPPPAPPPPPR
jgi:hypothetical protein